MESPTPPPTHLVLRIPFHWRNPGIVEHTITIEARNDVQFVVIEAAVHEAARIVTRLFEISGTHAQFVPLAVMADINSVGSVLMKLRSNAVGPLILPYIDPALIVVLPLPPT